MGQSNCQKVPKNANKSQNAFPLLSTVSKLLIEVETWSMKWMCQKLLPDLSKKMLKSATRLGKKSPKWQKIAKVAKILKSDKNHQSGKKSPKWLKVLKLGSKGFQGVSDGSRSQTAWARTTRGTYAWAPYAFAALGQGPKGPELVIYNL